MSPHLAAKLAPDLVSHINRGLLIVQPFPESNDELVHSISSYTRDVVSSLNGMKGALYVETAGGESYPQAVLISRCSFPCPAPTTHSIHFSTLTPLTSYPDRISTSRWYINNNSIIRVSSASRIHRLGRSLPPSAILPKSRISL